MNKIFQTFSQPLRVIIMIPLFLAFGYALWAVSIFILNSAWWGLTMEQLTKIQNLNNFPNKTRVLQVIQFLSQACVFLAPPVLFWLFFGKASVNRFLMNKPNISIWLVPILVILYIPVMEVISTFNERIIPEGSWLENTFKPMEESAAQLMESMLQMNGLGDLFINLFIMAFVPAICEEFLFRGLIQGQLTKLFKNIHLGIWFTAIIFSAIHLQFYGFLPRMVLGALFGYLMIHTGSIWTSVLAHLINNGLAVLTWYFVQHSDSINMEQIEQTGTSPSQLIIILGALGLMGVIFMKRSPWSLLKMKYYEVIMFDITEIPIVDQEKDNTSLDS